MNHISILLLRLRKSAATRAALPKNLFAFLFVFALLVSDTAAGLASGLAGSLAFAASAVLSAFAKVTGFDSLDMFHYYYLQGL